MDKHNIRNVDFLSIDTEGSELDILSTLDFSKYNIDVITIEDNYNDSELINFFEQRDYSLVEKIECDKIFQKITKLSDWRSKEVKSWVAGNAGKLLCAPVRWEVLRKTACAIAMLRADTAGACG